MWSLTKYLFLTTQVKITKVNRGNIAGVETICKANSKSKGNKIKEMEKKEWRIDNYEWYQRLGKMFLNEAIYKREP